MSRRWSNFQEKMNDYLKIYIKWIFFILDQKVLPIYDPYKIRKTESNIFEILWENSESWMKLSFPNPNEDL